MSPFEFIAPQGLDAPGEKFVLEVPLGIQSKGELLTALASAGQFPDYFGGNWDALLECLRDFEWVREKQIVIMHNDLPLRAYPENCRAYLEILREAANDWVRTADQSKSAINAPAFPDHELRVLFPICEQRAVLDVLTS